MTTVLMVTKHFYPTLGGVERYVHEISSRLAKSSYSIKIIAPSVHNRASHERMGDVDVLRFPVFSCRRLDFSPHMQSFMRTAQADIVHFHTFEILCRALRMGLKRDIPYFITTHGLIWKKPRNSLESLAKTLGRVVIRGNFVNAKKIFCVSQMDCLNAMKIVGENTNIKDKLSYLPSGVDVGKFSVSAKEEFKERHGYHDKVVITQVARFSPNKGQHIFLDAILKLSKKIPSNCIFFLVGYVQDKKYFSTLQQRAREMNMGDRLSFFPNITEADLLRIYKETDIVVLPSMAEGFPLSILEAWASKCSVIASEVGGIPYIAKDGEDSILVPQNNSEILAEEIHNLITDERLRRRLSNNAYERVIREFSWDRVVGAISREYEIAQRL